LLGTALVASFSVSSSVALTVVCLNQEPRLRSEFSTPLTFPSPWNHLESGILFGLRLPILVFREEDITGGIFDNGVSDVFVHPIPSPDITGTAKAALKQVFQRWAGKVREHYYDDKRA
jgi:hypothetical protein